MLLTGPKVRVPDLSQQEGAMHSMPGMIPLIEMLSDSGPVALNSGLPYSWARKGKPRLSCGNTQATPQVDLDLNSGNQDELSRARQCAELGFFCSIIFPGTRPGQRNARRERPGDREGSVRRADNGEEDKGQARGHGQVILVGASSLP